MHPLSSSLGSQVPLSLLLTSRRPLTLRLSYLHINGFIHRDVKAANLLIDDDGTVLLGDLGVAANLAEDTSPSTSKSQTVSSRYVASPRQQNSSHDSQGSAASGHSPHNSTRRVVLVEPTAAHSRPKIGKRKSFVGTVGARYLWLYLYFMNH